MTSAPPIVHIVDDDASFRRAIARLLQASGYRVLLYESGEQILINPPAYEPGCILLDIRMSGIGGLELQNRLAVLGHALPIVFLSGHADIATSVKAIKAGAEDFLAKPVAKKELLEVIERALTRYRETREQQDRLDALRALVARLTARESEVFALMIRGKLSKQIAFALGTSERTIKAHRHSIMQKLQVRSVAEAVSIAERLGITANPSSGDEPALA